MSTAISRRGFFTALSRPFQRMAAEASGPLPEQHRSKAVPAPFPLQQGAGGSGTPLHGRDDPGNGSGIPLTAIIQGRFCIALTSFCSVCIERCPVPGAMKKERGLPMVVPDLCTGCGICHGVCPAPRNAVLMLPRRPSPSSLPA